jgi:hypothetical protein
MATRVVLNNNQVDALGHAAIHEAMDHRRRISLPAEFDRSPDQPAMSRSNRKTEVAQ